MKVWEAVKVWFSNLFTIDYVECPCPACGFPDSVELKPTKRWRRIGTKVKGRKTGVLVSCLKCHASYAVLQNGLFRAPEQAPAPRERQQRHDGKSPASMIDRDTRRAWKQE